MVRGGLQPGPGADNDAWITSGEWRAWGAPAMIVRGTSSHLNALPQIVGWSREYHRCVLCTADLTRDPDNRDDPHAIVASINTFRVGRVDQGHAAALARLMDAEGPNTTIPDVPAALLIGTVTDVQDDRSSDGVQQVQVFSVALWINHESLAGRFPLEAWGGQTARLVAWDGWRDQVQQ